MRSACFTSAPLVQVVEDCLGGLLGVASPPRSRRAQPVAQRPVHRRFYGGRLGIQTEAVAQQHRDARGTSPAGWRRPCPRCPAPSRGPARTSRACRGARATRSGSIPIEPVSIAASSLRMSPNMFSVTITSKSPRRGDELHRGVVDEHVLERDVGNSAAWTRRHDLAPQPRRLQHVGLVDARDLAPRGAERGPRDALDLVDGVGAEVARRCRSCASSRRSRCRRSARGRRAGRCPR